MIREAASAASLLSRGADGAALSLLATATLCSRRPSWSSCRSPLRCASLRRLLCGVELVPRLGTTSMGSLTFSSQIETLKGRYERRRNGQFRDCLFRAYRFSPSQAHHSPRPTSGLGHSRRFRLSLSVG